MDVEMESWQVDIYDPLVQVYLNGDGIVQPPERIGWMGRIGMFVMPEVLQQLPFADFYKFYAAWPDLDRTLSLLQGSTRCYTILRYTILYQCYTILLYFTYNTKPTKP